MSQRGYFKYLAPSFHPLGKCDTAKDYSNFGGLMTFPTKEIDKEPNMVVKLLLKISLTLLHVRIDIYIHMKDQISGAFLHEDTSQLTIIILLNAPGALHFTNKSNIFLTNTIKVNRYTFR